MEKSGLPYFTLAKVYLKNLKDNVIEAYNLHIEKFVLCGLMMDQSEVRYDVSLLTAEDLHLFNEGRQFRLYQKLGSHIMNFQGISGTYFAVWAPNARQVSVMGNFNNWNDSRHHLRLRDKSGIWEGFIPNVGKGAYYKYHIHSSYNDYEVDKADPLGYYNEVSPLTASRVWDLDYEWSDKMWMEGQKEHNSLSAPISIYEVHLGSWRRVPEENNRFLSYREMAPLLADYVKDLGFTHVEFLPVMEHPFFGSWGYQTTGYFAPTSRYGTPQDLMYLVDHLHRHGIGVILDWVPSHFPDNLFGLNYFDGTHLYEHPDPNRGFHKDWNSFIFNYGKKEVQSFLISSALFWLDYYHADAIRVDGVASMLYLDYSRNPGEWVPNIHGGKENLEALGFIKNLNEQAYKYYPSIQTIAEESTSWPLVSRPIYAGGLGFGLKWDLGWMHDTLDYFSKNPLFRKFHHDKLTFRIMYAFKENFLLPLSHDEVVHTKGSLIQKMPGSNKDKFANLRLLFGYMYSQPGKKLIFMGSEFGQWQEWNHDSSLDWHLLDRPEHSGVKKWVTDLNRLYKTEKALYEIDFRESGFKWIDCADIEQSVISYMRFGNLDSDLILVVFNFTPVPRFNYRVGVPLSGCWKEVLNSDAKYYGGEGYGNYGRVEAEAIPFHGLSYSVNLTLPPLGVLFFKREDSD